MIDVPPAMELRVFNAAFDVAFTRAMENQALSFDMTSCTFTSRRRAACRAQMDVNRDRVWLRSNYWLLVTAKTNGTTAVVPTPDVWRVVSKQELYYEVAKLSPDSEWGIARRRGLNES